MKYSKPKVLAQNAKSGCFAAGCPPKNASDCSSTWGGEWKCRDCERTR